MKRTFIQAVLNISMLKLSWQWHRNSHEESDASSSGVNVESVDDGSDKVDDVLPAAEPDAARWRHHEDQIHVPDSAVWLSILTDLAT